MTTFNNNDNLIGSNINFLQAIRKEGQNKFAMPSNKDEYWKYCNLNNLEKNYNYAKPTLSDFDIDLNGYKIFFENGIFSPKNSLLPKGVEVLPLIEAIMQDMCNDYINKAAHLKDFVCLNNANLQEGVFIKVEKNINIKKPIIIIYNSSSSNTWSASRNIVVLEQSSSLELLEFFCGNTNHLNNVVNEFFVNENAKLNHYKICNTVCVSNTFANVKKDASFNSWCLKKNNSFAREDIVANLTDQGATSDIKAIYKTSDNNYTDYTILINHLAPNTTSSQLVKGVADKNAKAVYQGKIYIKKGCDNVVGNQQHRGIILSQHAKIDIKPELEIFNDDVKCSHGSAIGKIDADSLFYLRSRGLSEKEAKQLLIEAFLKDFAENIPNLDIKESFLLAI